MRKTLFILLILPITILLHAALPQFLTVEQAFNVQMAQDKNRVSVEVLLGKSIYLYADKVALKTSVDTSLEFTLPKPKMHEGLDGPEAVYMDKLAFDVIVNSQKKTQKDVTLTLSYQGCSEQGLCYPPLEHTQTFTIDFQALAQSADLSESDKIEAIFAEGVFMILLTFFGLGVLLSLTPCVFPMIPILSSIIVSQGEHITKRKAFMLSLVYVLFMALAYTIAGVVTGLLGANVQAALQTPWVIAIFSAIFIALALSMFGFFSIEVPKWVQTRVTKTSHNVEGKGYVSVAVMGFLSALIVGPCVAAPLAGALAYIGDTGDAVLGGSALFVMSLGMGLPLLAIGLGAGKFMPKPGVWMDSINAVFGVMMLAVAIWMLDRIVSPETTMLLSALLIIFSSIYIGAFDTIDQASRGWKRFAKGLGLIVFIYGLFLFFGVFSQGSYTDPLRALTSAKVKTAQKEGLQFTETVSSIEALDQLLQNAGDKVVMVDFTASWCVQCKELEAGAFSDERVIQATKDFILVKADITKATPQTEALKKQLEVAGPPALRFFKSGKEISRASRVQGVIEAEKLLEKLVKL